MAQLTRYIDVQTTLETAVAVAAAFGTTLFLGCDETIAGLGEVPIDRRVLEVTADDYADYLDSDSEAYRWCRTYFGQAYQADSAKIGRVVTAATSPYLIVTGGSQVAATYAAQTKINLKFSDGTHTQQIQFSGAGCTTFALVCAAVNTVLHALVEPTVTNLDHVSFGVDVLGRLYVVSAGATGDSAAPITLVASTNGEGEVDGFTSVYFGNTQAQYTGSDAETVTEALQAIRAADDAFYQIDVFHDYDGSFTVGIADADYLELAAYVAGLDKMLDIVINDADAKDALVVDDLASDLNALNADNVSWYYHEDPEMCPTAANNGFVYPQKEAACSFAYNQLALVTESGDGASLTTAEVNAIQDKGGNYIDTVSGVTFAYPGLTTSGKEKRLVFGVDWFDANVATDIFNIRINRQLPFAYDWPTFGLIEGVLMRWAKEAAVREILYPINDKDFPFTVTMPDPVDISTAIKATHEFEYEIYEGTVKSEILKWKITGKFRV